MMTNLAVLESVYDHLDAVNWGSSDRMARQLADDFVWTVAPERGLYVGAAGYRACLQWWRCAFPDFWLELTSLRCAEQWVFATHLLRGEQRGTLISEYGFVAATGIEVALPICELYQADCGVLSRIETYFDMADLLRQLGRSASFAPALPSALYGSILPRN